MLSATLSRRKTFAAKGKAHRRISACDSIYVMKATAKPRDDLRALQAELECDCVVTLADVPPDVITMNSEARLRDLAAAKK